MAFEKRVCVLKQIKKGFAADGKTLSGVVYAERWNEELTLNVRLVDTAPVREGRFALTVWVGGKIYCRDFESTLFKIREAPGLQGGFSALITFVKGDAEPVAFGSCGAAPSDYTTLLNVFKNEEKKKSRVQKREGTGEKVQPYCEIEQKEEKKREGNGYDDEAIASANYYGEAGKTHENGGADGAPYEKEAAEEIAGGTCENAEVEHPFGTGRTLAYYDTIKERLRLAFEKYPRDMRLNGIFPTGEWVRAEGALLGILYEKGLPRYLCIAVEKGSDPPKEFSESGVFVPLSHFTETEGFYVIFQDADTGEVLKIHNA